MTLYMLAGKFTRAGLADDGDLDLTGVIELLFNGLGDVATEPGRVAVGGMGGVGDDAHLAAGLDSVGMFDAGKPGSKRFQLFQALDVFLERFATGAGSGSANGIGRG